MNFAWLWNNWLARYLIIALVAIFICWASGLDAHIGFSVGSSGIHGDAGIERFGGETARKAK